MSLVRKDYCIGLLLKLFNNKLWQELESTNLSKAEKHKKIYRAFCKNKHKYNQISEIIRQAKTAEEKQTAFLLICDMVPCWLKLFAIKYANTKLNLDNFEDSLNDCYLSIISRLKLDIDAGTWYANINSFSTATYSSIDSAIEKCLEQQATKIKIKDPSTKEIIDVVKLERLEDIDEEYPSGQDVEEDYFKYQYELLDRVRPILSPKELKVLQERYGYVDGQPKTFREIGKMLNINRQDAFWVGGKAIKKIRDKHILEEFKRL